MPYPGRADAQRNTDAGSAPEPQQRPKAKAATSDGAEGPEGQPGPGGLFDVPDQPGPADPASEIAYFLSVPWCRAHLRPGEGRPPGSAAAQTAVRIVQPTARRRGRGVPEPGGALRSDPAGLDNTFAVTLNTPDTIGAFLLFHEEPAAGPAADGALWPPVLELKALLQIGPGLSGHRGVMHGGLVATILDEVLGLLIPLNRRRAHHNQAQAGVPWPASSSSSSSPSAPLSPPEVAAAASALVDRGFVTGYLNITYVRPVRTMSNVLVTARYVRMEGPRKFFIEGAVWDGDAQLLARADCLFITLKEKL